MFFIHIGLIFKPLRMTEYIEYLKVFDFSGYFVFLEQNYREKCKFINVCVFLN